MDDNTPTESPLVSQPATGADGKSPPRQRPLLLALLLLFALLLVWQWLDNRSRGEELRQELARRLAVNDALVHESQTVARQSQEAVVTLQARVAALEGAATEAQSQQVALESMYQELSRTRDERVLAEVEQSITIAAQQLQLAGNVEAALIALNGADARLARAAQPQFLPLRRLIARDIANLTTLPVADISGMAVKLESIVAEVDQLPLAFEQRPGVGNVSPAVVAKTSAVTPGWWRTLLEDFWSETRQLIRIERVDRADPALLSPSQAVFLRENIKLRLVDARLALLARDSRSFREDTRQAAEWLERYFDTRARPVQSALATVKALSGLDIVQQAPSLNETLTAVRNFKPGKK